MIDNMRSQSLLKPQDVAIVIMVLCKNNDSNWRQVEVAEDLFISQGEVAKSLARLKKAGLISGKRVNRAAIKEFLIHAVKYLFPVEVGALGIGIRTAVMDPFFKNSIIQNDEDIYVWPSPKGTERGQVITPFYKNLAEAARNNKKFYEICSIVELLRLGRVREKNIASQELMLMVDNL